MSGTANEQETPTGVVKASVRPGRFDRAEWKQSTRGGRDGGCRVYISMEQLAEMGIDPHGPAPLYRIRASADRPRVVISLKVPLMSAPEHRPTPTQAFRELAMAVATRQASAPESTVEIGVTAKRLHTWTVTVRGEDAEACARVAQRLDDELAAKFAHELDSDTLAGDLARSK